MRKLSFKDNLWSYLLLSPFLLFFGVFLFYPIGKSIYLSLFRYGVGIREWIGFGNYINLIKDPLFIRSIINTAYFVLIVVSVNIVFSLLLSLMIYEKSRKVQSFFRAAFYLPAVTTSVILAMVWSWIYDINNGFANYLLSVFHIPPVLWLADTRIALPALALIVITWTVGGYVILYLSSLGSVPVTYYESADIDGASYWTKFFKITLPLIKPTTLYVFVMGTIGSFQIFEVVQLLTNGGPTSSTSTVMFLIYQTAFHFNQLGKASAMGVVLSVIIGVIAIIQFKLLSTDVEY